MLWAFIRANESSAGSKLSMSLSNSWQGAVLTADITIARISTELLFWFFVSKFLPEMPYTSSVTLKPRVNLDHLSYSWQYILHKPYPKAGIK